MSNAIAGVTVSLQGDQSVDEGDPVSICVDLSDVPGGGLECNVVVLLNSTDGKASKLTQLQSYFFVYVNGSQLHDTNKNSILHRNRGRLHSN